MKKNPGRTDVGLLIQDSLDFGYSISKFIKYCEHLVSELDMGQYFSDEGFRGKGYTAIILTQLGQSDDKTMIINIDTVINTLYELLVSDYFDDNLQLFSHTYGLFKKLIKFSESDINYSGNIQEIHKRKTELYSGNYKYLLAAPIHQFQGEIQKKMRECLNIFNDLCDFLKILANSHIYIGDATHQTIHPKYAHFKDSFHTLVDEYEFWELTKYDEAVERGKYNGERCNDNDLIDWYNEVDQLPLEAAVLQFSIFLLKSGEFDILINRDDIKTYILQLARRVSKDRVAEVEGYKFKNNSEYIDTDLTDKTEKIIDILMSVEHDSITENAGIIDEYLHLLRSKHIITQKELLSALQSDDIEDTLHSIISCDILGKNKISHPTLKKKCIDFCEQYNQRIKQETPKKIDSILDEDDVSEEDGVDEFPEDEFIDFLYKGITILENLQEIGYELYSYDVLKLIELAQEKDIIGDDIAEELSLGDDSGYIIYKILQAVIDNNYLEEIGREDLLEDYKNHLYALNMLFFN